MKARLNESEFRLRLKIQTHQMSLMSLYKIFRLNGSDSMSLNFESEQFRLKVQTQSSYSEFKPNLQVNGKERTEGRRAPTFGLSFQIIFVAHEATAPREKRTPLKPGLA